MRCLGLPPPRKHVPTETSNLATHTELAAFLGSVERRAYRQALFAVREEQGALDIVQDAMLKLADRYASM